MTPKDGDFRKFNQNLMHFPHFLGSFQESEIDYGFSLRTVEDFPPAKMLSRNILLRILKNSTLSRAHFFNFLKIPEIKFELNNNILLY